MQVGFLFSLFYFFLQLFLDIGGTTPQGGTQGYFLFLTVHSCPSFFTDPIFYQLLSQNVGVMLPQDKGWWLFCCFDSAEVDYSGWALHWWLFFLIYHLADWCFTTLFFFGHLIVAFHLFCFYWIGHCHCFLLLFMVLLPSSLTLFCFVSSIATSGQPFFCTGSMAVSVFCYRGWLLFCFLLHSLLPFFSASECSSLLCVSFHWMASFAQINCCLFLFNFNQMITWFRKHSPR